ncbi:MAG: gliding motility-associated C-terminal domain-containing protein [Saprospiraceae bacterium]
MNNIRYIFCLLVMLSYSVVAFSQEVYLAPEVIQNNPLTKLNLQTCQEEIVYDSMYFPVPLTFYFADLALTKNNSLFAFVAILDLATFTFANEIVSVGANGLLTSIYSDSIYSYPGLVADSSGVLFSVGSNFLNLSDNVLLQYDLNTNLYTLSALPAGLNYVGDEIFYNGKLYACCVSGEIWEVNTTTPIQSSMISIAHNAAGDTLPIYGLISTKITCDSTKVFSINPSLDSNGNSQIDFYEIDIYTGLCSYICSADRVYAGMTSLAEFAPPPAATTQYDTMSVCMGNQVVFNNNTYTITQDTVLCNTYINILGCDSTRCLTLTVAPTLSFNQQVERCEGDVFPFENLTLSRDTSICRTYVTTLGCDSTFCLNLAFRDTTRNQLSQQICSGSSFVFEGQTYASDTVVCRTYTNILGCDSARCLTLTVAPLQTSISPTDTTINLGTSVQLTAQANGFNYSVLWQPAESLDCDTCRTVIASPTLSTFYTVILTDERGCVATERVRVNVSKEYPYFAPTAFSPNGDGLNDEFALYYGASIVAVQQLQVFDRWGNQVFIGKNLASRHGWDGTWNGQALGEAVYVWWATLQLASGIEVIVKGDVTLLR